MLFLPVIRFFILAPKFFSFRFIFAVVELFGVWCLLSFTFADSLFTTSILCFLSIFFVSGFETCPADLKLFPSVITSDYLTWCLVTEVLLLFFTYSTSMVTRVLVG